jgi:PAS domain S-box-containing protein
VTASEALDVSDLRRRLAEAEATIAALLSGQIDAVIDSTSRTPVLLANAQQALREERDRAHRYLNTPEVILLALDVDGRVTLANRYACAILGWTADELMGRSWSETCLPVRFRVEMSKAFREFVGGEVGAVVENPVLTRTGQERLIEWRNTLLRDNTDCVIGTFSCGTDITDRRQAEIALRNTTAELVQRTATLEQHETALRVAEERTQYALSAAQMGVWELHLASQRLTWSDTMAAVFGLKPEQAPPDIQSFLALIHPDDRRLVTDGLASAERDRTDFKLEFRVLWPDGTTRWVAGQARMVRSVNDRPERWLGLGTDISDRRSLEAQFRQAQKMEAFGQLAGGVAHDFNNLLTAILGFSELVLERVVDQPDVTADVQEIRKAGERASELTRQLLAFSRKQLLVVRVLDLNQVVYQFEKMLRRIVSENIRLEIVAAPVLGKTKADPGQIEQLLMNLVVNARDAMPQGGALTITTANVVVDTDFAHQHGSMQPGKYVSLTVRDEGTGMSPTVLARVFEPFFTTKGPGKGTGLGLSTVFGLVEQSGGHISIESTEGIGTAVTTYWPTTVEHAQSTPAATGSAVTGGGTETILLVEDETGVRHLIGRVLQRYGYTVLSARGGEEAMALEAKFPDPIHLLVSDMVMPGLSGPDIAQRIVRRRPEIQVLFVSGYASREAIDRGVSSHNASFLQKPFRPDTLAQKVRERLDRQRIQHENPAPPSAVLRR